MATENNLDYWQQLVEAFAQGIVILNKNGDILYVNQCASEIFGIPTKKLIGTHFIYPLTHEVHEVEILKPNGDIETALMTVKEGAWQNKFAWIISLEDITDFKTKEQRLKIASLCFNSAFEGIIITDDRGHIIEANQAYLKMTGFKKHEVIGQLPGVFRENKQSSHFYKYIWKILYKRGHWSGELWDEGKNNTPFPVFTSVTAVKNSEGDIINYIGFFYDLTIIKQKEQQIEHIKYYDLLTGLPNKFLLIQKLEHYLEHLADCDTSLILLSIRIFDPANKPTCSDDSFKTRDGIVLEAAKRIEKALADLECLARTGYSEFVAIYMPLHSQSKIDTIVKNIIDNLAEPFQIKNKIFNIQTVIGLTIYDKGSAISAEELLHQAEMARHKAKQIGVNTYEFFDPKTEIQVVEFNRHIEAVRQAIQQNQFELFYQPKVNLKSEKIIGVEALIRWHHPLKGIQTPNQFLLNLMDHPISLEIDNWTLDTALQQLEKFIENGINIPISVNISSYQLQNKDFVQNIESILARYPHIPNHYIMLEILETEALEDLELVSKVIKEFKDRNILFALDDFGTGYSSLTYLKELMTAEVKLDQSFVRDILIKPQDIPILKTTIELCHLLDRRLIAEGVESIIHGKLLQYIGCHCVQGYAIAKPIPSTDIIPWLKSWQLDPLWKENRFSREEFNELMTLGTKHYMDFQTIQRLIKHNQPLPLGLTILEKCPIESWLLKHQHQFKDEQIFLRLYKLHQKQHELVNKILQQNRLSQQRIANNHLKKLDILSSVILKTVLVGMFG